MSMFEALTSDDWAEAGAPGTVSRGQYGQILQDFVDAGIRYARISLGEGAPLAGKKATSVATALKNAKDSKNAPESFEAIKVSARKDAVFLENTAVAA